MKGKRNTTGSPFEAMAAYPRAVVDEDIVYISGTTGYDARNKCYPSDVKEQAIIAFSIIEAALKNCLLYTSPSPRDATLSRMPSSA